MTKRKLFVLALMLALALALALFAACDRGDGTSIPSTDGDVTSPTPSPAPTPSPTAAPSPEPPFEGKIAIVTNEVFTNEEVYHSAEALHRKYGADKIIHRVWPYNHFTDGDLIITVLQEIAADPDLKAVIINHAVSNTNAAVDKLLEVRPDVFVAYCCPYEDPSDVVSRANLSIDYNEQLRGETIVMQAKAMGAKVFAHYSFPRLMAVPAISQRHDIMMDVCEREGLTFVDLAEPDPYGDLVPGMAQFTLEDIPKQVARWGKDTAFFSTNCGMQVSLIVKVIDEGAIFPEPCCPSPYHGFPPALGIDTKIYDGTTFWVNDAGEAEDIGRLRPVGEIIEEIKSIVAYIVADRGATVRLATWPVPTSMMFTAVATEYAIKWINGEVPQEKGNIDCAAIEELCEAYIFEVTGERLGVEINPLVLRGRAYNSYLLFLLDSIVF